MTECLIVTMNDVVAGRLERLSGDNLRFRYDSGYQADANRTPLSLSMPKAVDVHSDSAVRPWLWGLLPDNDSVLRRWGREFGVRYTSPFALLSTPIGHDCAGAVRFAKEDELTIANQGSVEWLTVEQVGERLSELRIDDTSWLGQNFTGQFSLAGAQAKTAMLFEDGCWGVPSGDIPTTHILKPAITGIDDHDLNEHLCLDAAGRTGLITAETKISRFGDETAVVVTRYDRTKQPNGQLGRIHQEDLCQALSVDPRSKYQSDGGPSAANIANLFRSMMRPRDGADALWRFAEALAWNWIIGGTDAHAKNYSLLLAGRQVRLAPLYDVASALPYGAHERKLRLAMKIGTSYEVYTRRNAWAKAAKDLGLDPEELIERVRELAEAAPQAFSEAAAEPQVRELDRELPARLADLVAERSTRCLKLLET